MDFRNCLFGISIIVFLGCSSRQTGLQFEQKVLYQIVPQIIDSEFPDTSEGFMLKKTVDGSSVWMKETSANTIIGILDSVYEFDQKFYKKYINLHFSNHDLKLAKLNSAKAYKLDISKIKKSKNYYYQYLSEIPDSKIRWKRKKEFYLMGLVGFSRIYFDKERKNGVLDFTMSCGQQCGMTALVYLKNENGDWKVDEIESIIEE
nr:hypothetical protein [uncultured Allomuricauda sp.]